MFGFSTPDSKPDTERGSYEEGEWYGEANDLLTEPVEQGSVEQPGQDRAAKSKPMAWEAQPVQYQPVALMSVSREIGSGQNQEVAQMPLAHGVYPVQYHATAHEDQPVKYQFTHGVQPGQYQAVTQVPLEHGMYPAQYHAMALGAQPVQYERMKQVPIAEGGQLHNMLVSCKVQFIDSSIQPQLTYMHPQVQGVTSPPVVPVPQMDRSGFCDYKLLEMAKVTFLSARQAENESVDDWADRVCTLAGNAYRDLSEEYVLQKSILRFCMGAKERESGERVINHRPVSIEQAIDQLKWDIFTHGTMYRPKSVRNVDCAGQVKVAGEKLASQGMLVDRVVALERKIDTLEKKMDIFMGTLDQLLARPTRSPSPSPVRQQCFNCNTMGRLRQYCPNSIHNDKGQSVIVGQMKSDPMSQINASVNDLAIQAVIDTATEDTLVLGRVVAKLPKKLPVLEQVRECEWVVHKQVDTIDGVGAALGLSGQVVHIAQERGRTYVLGKGNDMLHGSQGCVVIKAVSDFRIIQEWLIHGTDPPGNECLTTLKESSFNANRDRLNNDSLKMCKLDNLPVRVVREQKSCGIA
ncbi:hypothetical protein DPMN_086608 [Dreissena polymorpha]|uniref:CCHC-type domain-containing protein n=1 Tax=Dreissena polymorpha TaxID=45954 RepID=A0A9D4QW46_DREPO|nr:hypothetical protein DPMN_086608 [Dreissena polymorpha]